MTKAMTVKRLSKSHKVRAKFNRKGVRIVSPKKIKDLRISLVFAVTGAPVPGPVEPTKAKR